MIETRKFSVFSALFLLAGLAGCGGGETETSSEAAEAEVRVIVTGDIESTLATNGSIFCGPGEGSDPDFMFELYASSSTEMLNLRLNRALEPGDHPIVGSDDPGRDTGADAYFYYRGPDRNRFDRVDSGTITIDNVPIARGEELIASIEAEVSSEDEMSVEISADLRVPAGSQTFDDCP